MTTSPQANTATKPSASSNPSPQGTRPQSAPSTPDHLGCRDLYQDRDPFGRG